MWRCGHCTFVHEESYNVGFLRCEVCGQARGAPPPVLHRAQICVLRAESSAGHPRRKKQHCVIVADGQLAAQTLDREDGQWNEMFDVTVSPKSTLHFSVEEDDCDEVPKTLDLVVMDGGAHGLGAVNGTTPRTTKHALHGGGTIVLMMQLVEEEAARTTTEDDDKDKDDDDDSFSSPVVVRQRKEERKSFRAAIRRRKPTLSLALMAKSSAETEGATVIAAAVGDVLRLVADHDLDLDHGDLATIRRVLRKANTTFVDVAFPPLDSRLEAGATWRRPTQFFNTTRYALFDGDIEPSSVVQGTLRNCWLLSALSAVAEFPHLIRRCFPLLPPLGGENDDDKDVDDDGTTTTTTTSKDIDDDGATKDGLEDEGVESRGIYRAQLCHGGTWRVVTVDDYFPCGAKTGTPRYARSRGSELWAMVVEKAAAKLCGSYARLAEGHSGDALVDVTGFPTITYSFEEPDIKKKLDDGSLFAFLRDADRRDFIICASTYGKDTVTGGGDHHLSPGGGGAASRRRGPPPPPPARRKTETTTTTTTTKEEASSLVPGHAYSLLSVCALDGHRLVRLRNPWSKFEWTGDFGDGDPRWTEDLTKRIAASLRVDPSTLERRKRDGTFWMKFDDFRKHFHRLSICLPHGPSRRPWTERRRRGSFSLVKDETPAILSKLSLDRASQVYVMAHQTDARVQGANPRYADLGVAVLRRRQEGCLVHHCSVSPAVQRQVICPAPKVDAGGFQAQRPWPPGDYLVVAFSADCRESLRPPRYQSRAAWPAPKDAPLVTRTAVAEVFDRFDAGLKGYLDGRDLEKLQTFADDPTLFGDLRRQQLPLNESRFREWLLSEEDYPLIFHALGYEPGPTPREAPVLTTRLPVVISAHAEEHAGLRLDDVAVDDRPTADLVERAQTEAILHAAGGVVRSHHTGLVETCVAHAPGGRGISIAARNLQTKHHVRVAVDASKSENCTARSTDILTQDDMKVEKILAPLESKILMHLAPQSLGRWKSSFNVDCSLRSNNNPNSNWRGPADLSFYTRGRSPPPPPNSSSSASSQSASASSAGKPPLLPGEVMSPPPLPPKPSTRSTKKPAESELPAAIIVSNYFGKLSGMCYDNPRHAFAAFAAGHFHVASVLFVRVAKHPGKMTYEVRRAYGIRRAVRAIKDHFGTTILPSLRTKRPAAKSTLRRQQTR